MGSSTEGRRASPSRMTVKAAAGVDVMGSSMEGRRASPSRMTVKAAAGMEVIVASREASVGACMEIAGPFSSESDAGASSVDTEGREQTGSSDGTWLGGGWKGARVPTTEGGAGVLIEGNSAWLGDVRNGVPAGETGQGVER